jgi:hypothetical protein
MLTSSGTAISTLRVPNPQLHTQTNDSSSNSNEIACEDVTDAPQCLRFASCVLLGRKGTMLDVLMVQAGATRTGPIQYYASLCCLHTYVDLA